MNSFRNNKIEVLGIEDFGIIVEKHLRIVPLPVIVVFIGNVQHFILNFFINIPGTLIGINKKSKVQLVDVVPNILRVGSFNGNQSFNFCIRKLQIKSRDNLLEPIRIAIEGIVLDVLFL